MTVDPVDDCTFWYTQEYFSTTGFQLEDPHRELQVPDLLGGNSNSITYAHCYLHVHTDSHGYSYRYSYVYTHNCTDADTNPPNTVACCHAATVACTYSDLISTTLTSFVQTGDHYPQDPNVLPIGTMVGFQGDFTFNSIVVTFQVRLSQGAGLTATNWNVSAQHYPGGGSIRTLRISAFSNNLTPLSGSGTLFQLNMPRVGGTAVRAPLTWKAAPDNFFFIDASLNSRSPSSHTGRQHRPSRQQRQSICLAPSHTAPIQFLAQCQV